MNIRDWRWIAAIGSMVACCACNSPLIRSQSPELDVEAALEEPVETKEKPKLVGDVAVGAGLRFQTVQGVGLVNGLAGTGSDPPPSPLRTSLIAEIQSHDVRGAAKLLASSDNSLVTIKALLPPGVQKGDIVDLEVRVPRSSKSTSLRGGFLLPARLQEMRLLDNAIRTGKVSATATGPIIVDAAYRGQDDEVDEVRGRILGGGRALVSRPLFLMLKPDFRSPRVSQRLGVAINSRFHRYDRGDKRGVAKPINDRQIELAVHQRYRHNVVRFMRVVRAIAFNENATDRAVRLDMLSRKIMEPTTASRAAIELEAIGEDGIPHLVRALGSTDSEVRFYAAEALAYLDDETAADYLAEAAETEPAFRWHSLTALSAMNHVSAYDALTTLLHLPSAETRYGAYRALRTRNPNDPLVRPTEVWNGLEYHVIPTNGPPMVHFSRSRRPEIVLFGHEQVLNPPAFLFAGKTIMVKGTADGQIRVSRFSSGEAGDETITCPPRLDPVIRAIAKLGGDYADIMQAVREARTQDDLPSKLVVDALARPNRRYYRDKDGDSEQPAGSVARAASPVPVLFAGADEAEREQAEEDTTPDRTGEPFLLEEDEPEKGFLDKLIWWPQ